MVCFAAMIDRLISCNLARSKCTAIRASRLLLQLIFHLHPRTWNNQHQPKSNAIDINAIPFRNAEYSSKFTFYHFKRRLYLPELVSKSCHTSRSALAVINYSNWTIQRTSLASALEIIRRLVERSIYSRRADDLSEDRLGTISISQRHVHSLPSFV